MPMYSGFGFNDFEIGDVHVVRHEGLYHLFHLVLPNHAYIAHAVSRTGLEWKRVKNAVFISDPPAWDDDMVWTMHVSPNPYTPGSWRMFYTGLSMGERCRVQRIGLALSDDLYNWRKSRSDSYPLSISGPDYETGVDEGRHWVSFRDPFYFNEAGRSFLLAAARVKKGPLIRRGCVALIEETSEDAFRIDAPLFQPMHYDDIEVPSLFKLRGRYYLIGSIREDVKVHYWWADAPRGPYRNFSDNDLLPKGNYAARISREGHRFLVWSFFYKGLTTKGRHLMAPPKELVVDDNGELHLQSFRGFNDIARESLGLRELTPLTPLLGNPDAWSERTGSGCAASCTSGFEAFLLQGEYENFMLSGELTIEDSGKHGLVFRINEDGDGYYLAVDPSKGTVQLRAWGQRPRGNPEEEFAYEEVQSADYVPTTGPLSFRLIAYEQYLEFSLNGYVLLTAADDHYARGRAGFYVGDARVRVDRPVVKRLSASEDENFPVHIVDL